MRTTTAALQSLHQVLDTTSPNMPLGTWRWSVRQQMAGVRDLLISESTQHEDEWLAARGGTVLRERNALLGRLSVMGPRVLESDEVEVVREAWTGSSPTSPTTSSGSTTSPTTRCPWGLGGSE